MLGVEERGMRRTLLYAAMTNDEDNNADGTFSVTCFFYLHHKPALLADMDDGIAA